MRESTWQRCFIYFALTVATGLIVIQSPLAALSTAATQPIFKTEALELRSGFNPTNDLGGRATWELYKQIKRTSRKIPPTLTGLTVILPNEMKPAAKTKKDIRLAWVGQHYTIGEAIEILINEFPNLQPHIFNKGQLWPHLTIYLGETSVDLSMESKVGKGPLRMVGGSEAGQQMDVMNELERLLTLQRRASRPAVLEEGA